MRHLLLSLTALPALVGAGWAAGPEPGRDGPALPDTIVWRDLLAPRPLADLARGGVAEGPAPLRMGLKPVRLGPALDAPPLPPIRDLRLPGERSPRAEWVDRVERWGRPGSVLRTALLRAAERPGRPAEPVSFLPPPDTARPAIFQDPPARDTAAGEPAELGALFGEYANLGMRVQSRAELGGDWRRFRPCETQLQESCNPTLLPQLSPDLRFNVQVGGSITDRIFVDVDFDQLREFESANTINIVYQGAPDDVVGRLEVGDVNFRLPPSRYLTEGIPAGNFGVRADGQVGPVDFQGVWAEQRGDLSSRVFRLTGVGTERRFVQEDTVELDDADYARGQFFFLVDPRQIADHPHLDVLDLDAGSAPSTVVPGIEPVQVYRFDNDPQLRQQVEGGAIQADAVARSDGDEVVEAAWFRYLQPGRDYFVHSSGLWIALRNPLSREEMLAVTYVTAAGDTVGDYNPEALWNQGIRPELRLLKASGANHQPGRPTWDQEMHNVYRVSGSPDVEPTSVEVTVSLGALSSGRTFKRGPAGEDVTFLRLFGLDRESPVDEVDPAAVYSPGRDFFEAQPAVPGTFLVFPTLEPFSRPPPLPELGLDADDTAELLGEDANDRIYDDPDPFERENGGRFRLTIPFRVRSEGVITSFSLGALGVLAGSERLFLNDQLLVRGVDYEIDYDVGQVTLLDPEGLFAADPEAAIRATWEQKQLFRTAPTSVLGVNATTAVGTFGAIDLIGLYRSERTLVTRPTLGVEPGAVALGGVNGRISFAPEWMDRLLAGVPGLRSSGTSSFTLDGEAALSLPDPNTRDAVFLDDFDTSDERPLSLFGFDWNRGSAPASRAGAEDVLPPVVDASDVSELVWQHTWIQESPQGDSVGVHEGFLPRQEVDERIRVAGSTRREPALLLSYGPRETFDDPRWASVTTVLSSTGADLTRSEFLEFYVSGGQELSLVIDLGLVSEDAMFLDEDGSTSGTKDDGVPWGLGLLDQEADPRRGQVWGNDADARGVWGETCLAEPGRIYRIADPRAVCTRGNGRNDSEDLDGDGNLDETESHLRYVVRLDGSSPYLARSRDETGTRFRLFRIPLQGPAAVEVGGPITDANLRNVRHLRFTVAGPTPGSLTLARMRIVGSRWVRRAEEGVVRGLVGDTASFQGRVEVTPVSRLTDGDAYQAPPGVLEQLADPASAFGSEGVEFNEKSLAVRFEDVQPGNRAEVYNRFSQRPRDFLTYRQARLWVVARSGDFGPEAPNYFFFKVGTDPENFYLYRTRLPAPPAGGRVVASDWLPEVVVDFEEWLDLRRRAEELLLMEVREPGDPPVTVWSPDSTYAVVLRDRGRAPNLASVREMSMGVWNGGEVPAEGEVWVNELRLSAAVRDAGVASYVDARLAGADVLESRLTWSRRGSFFRQLEEDPTYQDDGLLSFNSRLRLGRFTPAGWGVELPLSVLHERTTRDPTFLSESDVPALRLPGLRDTGTRQTRVSLGFRKSTPSADPVVSALLDGLDANVAWYESSASTVTARRESEGLDARLGYSRSLDRRDVAVVPAFLRPALRALLPGFLEEHVVDARLRWSPERIGVGTSYERQDNEIFRFDEIIARPTDAPPTPTRAPRESLETAADVRFRPFQSTTADVTFLSTRDLVDPEDAVNDPRVRALLARERAGVGGLDVGWETRRVVRTRVGVQPRFLPWLEQGVDLRTHYVSDRNANFIQETAMGLDTLLALARNASSDRGVEAFVRLDAAAMGRDLFGPPADAPDPGAPAPDPGAPDPAEPDTGDPAAPRAGDPRELKDVLAELLDLVLPVSLGWQNGLASRFNRDAVTPGAGYQLGLGGVGSFRLMDGDTAATVTDRAAFDARSGLRLSSSITLETAYRTSEVDILDTRSDRTVRDRTWPDLRARIEDSDGWAGTPVDRLVVATGFQRNTREIAFGGPAQQRRVQEDVQVPLELTLGWAEAATLRYSGSFRTGDGVDPTGDTERDQGFHTLSFNSTVRPPDWLRTGLEDPLRLGVIASYRAERECRVVRFLAECVAFIDQINRALSLTLDTEVRGFEVGVQGSWNRRQSFVGQRFGSTQLQLSLFGQFLFEAGPSPATLRMPGAG